MKNCEQAPGFSIYQHGLDVANRYRDLYRHLLGEKPVYEWTIPKTSLEQLRSLLPHALDPREARTYHVLHDCGKPFCITIDEQGRRHFPGHADRSYEIFKQLYPDDARSAELIRLDMACHTARGDELANLAKNELAPTLCLTAWAELYSNAEQLFGGFESTSFKIKHKTLCKAVKKIEEQNPVK